MNKQSSTSLWLNIVLIVALVSAAFAPALPVQAAIQKMQAPAALEAMEFTCSSVSEIPLAECEALVALYNSTNGDGWFNHTGWLVTYNPCSWYGVTCDQGHVLRLYSSSNNLTGNIPEELALLTNLQALFLSENQLSGNIPTTLGNLTNLNTLGLSWNQLSGNIPATLGNLTNLNRLDFLGNQLSGNIPATLGNLTNLQELSLGMNQLSGNIPATLGNLTNLQHLSIYINQLSGNIPATMGNLTNLQHLSLGMNQLSGSIPSELGDLTNLFTLFLSNNQLSGSIPPELGNLAGLKQLYLSSNPLSGPLPVSLTNLQLQAFYFTGTGLCVPADPTFQDWLAGIPNLGITQFCPPAQVSGTVTNSSGSPVPGVTLWAGTGISTTTDVYGQYLFSNLDSGSYTITPQMTGLAFTPPFAEITVPPDQTGVSFTASLDGPFTCASVTQIPLAECEALVALYNSTNGDAWTNRTGWSVSNTPCSWYGVTCGQGHVLRLTSSSNNLTGNIPEELALLTNLQVLILSDNQLSGNIPATLGNLTNLKMLFLSGNQLSGGIPPELGNLNNLEYLRLGDNQLSGNIPTTLGNLTNLNTLGLSWNQLSGNIPATLGNLTNLNRLDFLSNQLSGNIPATLGNLTNLQELSLGRNQLSGNIPATLGNLTNLQHLSIYINQLSGNIPATLGNLTNLQHLSLGMNQLSGSIPEELGQLTNLSLLSLFSNQLSGSIPPELGNLASLTQLNLSSNPLSGPLPMSLTNLQLTAFYFTGTGLCAPSDPTFKDWLAGIPYLGFTQFCPPSQVSGTVTNSSGSPVPGVTLWAGTGISTTTNENGQYLFSNLDPGSYTITPQMTGVTFTPPFAEIIVPPDQTGVSFTASLDSPFTCASVTQIPQAECEVLVALYDSTDGGGWDYHTGWLFTNTPCSWYGVYCLEGHVSTLGLSENDLHGNIPEELGLLTNLLWIDLSMNHLSGSIPSELGNLNNLQVINLADNQLSGNIPATFGNLTNLNMLILCINRLSGNIPATLGNLSNLNWLNLFDNQLSGNIPPELGNLTNLIDLELDHNQLNGGIPPELGNLTSLIYLELQNNQLNGAIPPELGNLVNLNRLQLNHNQLIGEIPSQITNLVNLHQNPSYGWVDFGYNGLSATDPSVVAFLNEKDPDWAATQTIAPSGLATAIQDNGVLFTWTPIVYTQDGGYYEISYALDASGPYTVHGSTPDKVTAHYLLPDLVIGNTYHLRVRTFTPAHGSQQNDLWSSYASTTVFAPVHAAFEADHTSGLAPLDVTFTNLSTGDFTTCTWTFGDGTESDDCSGPSHTYTAPGVYTVSLSVSGPGGTATETKTAFITVYTAVHAAFEATPTSGSAPLTVAFTNLSTGGFTTCTWTFGDGSQSTGCSNPTHIYTQPGIFTVTLTVTGAANSDTVVKQSYITVVEGETITLDPDEPGTLTFTGPSGNPTTIDIPAGAVTQTTTLVFTPVHTADAPEGFLFAGHAFHLEAYRDGTLLDGFSFAKPVVVTIHYSHQDVEGIDETTLQLLWWDDSTQTWQDAACGTYVYNPEANWFQVPICHLSQFAVFGTVQPAGPTATKLYLPLTMR